MDKYMQKQQERREWLEGVQAGDEVIVTAYGSVYGHRYERKTRTIIRIGNKEYRRKDGEPRGDRESWSRGGTKLDRPDDPDIMEHEAEQRIEKERHRMADGVQKFIKDWRTCDLETLRELSRIVLNAPENGK